MNVIKIMYISFKSGVMLSKKKTFLFNTVGDSETELRHALKPKMTLRCIYIWVEAAKKDLVHIIKFCYKNA